MCQAKRFGFTLFLEFSSSVLFFGWFFGGDSTESSGIRPGEAVVRMRKGMAENPPALERWLEIATANLAEEGKARVRAEIEAHYWEAYDLF